MSAAAAGAALCPSAPGAPGASLIGVVGSDGRVANLLTPLRIDAHFLETAAGTGGLLGKRFRFASPCQQAHCGHWADHECGLIGRLRHAAVDAGHVAGDAPLPPCAIRAQCRWWQQRGRDACGVCSLVVTDQRAPLTEAPR